MAGPTLLLDLDGTIWDSRPWYVATIARLSGGPASEIETRLADGANVIRVADDHGLTRSRLVRSASGNTVPIDLYEGVRQTLDRLQERSTPMGVVSNLSGSLAAALLKAAGLEKYFAAVVTPRIGVPAKPQPHGIRKALAEMGRTLDKETWYVGDGTVDAVAANAAGVRFAWVSYGYEAKAPPGTHAVIVRFEDVLHL